MKILHIAAHMGGGIGSAYVGLGTCGLDQTILLLEKPIDLASLEKVQGAGFRILVTPDKGTLRRELTSADLVLFNWTHHPALTQFLYEFPEIPLRSILWCHVSGNYFPHISAGLVQAFDRAIFATPYSLELPQLKALGDRCGVVYGLNDLSRFTALKRRSHDRFTVGYVGTLGFCKLHPDFVAFCASVPVPDVQFALVGQPSTKDWILASAEKKGISERFHFYGQRKDVAPALEEMDVFGYLLNPQHFGATENALLEAMAAGLPVIVLDQCVERMIIRDGETGLLVHSPEEYGNAVQYLYEHPEIAARLGEQAREDVTARFAIEKNRKRFLDACEQTMALPKRKHSFTGCFSGQPADWFLSGVGADRVCFEEDRPQDAGRIFRERTKGSPMHYHSYFPGDKRLARWAEQLSK